MRQGAKPAGWASPRPYGFFLNFYPAKGLTAIARNPIVKSDPVGSCRKLEAGWSPVGQSGELKGASNAVLAF